MKASIRLTKATPRRAVHINLGHVLCVRTTLFICLAIVCCCLLVLAASLAVCNYLRWCCNNMIFPTSAFATCWPTSNRLLNVITITELLTLLPFICWAFEQAYSLLNQITQPLLTATVRCCLLLQAIGNTSTAMQSPFLR